MEGTMAGADAFPGLPKELPFSVAEYEARIRRVREVMRERGLDALLVHHPSNVFYLSGYYSTVMFYHECVVVPLDGPVTLAVLNWEEGAARLHAWLERLALFPALNRAPEVIAAVLQEHGLARGAIGVEQWSAAMTAQKFAAFQHALPMADIRDASGLVEQVKLLKSPQEIAYVREAARLSDLGMQASIETAAPGKTDNEIAAAAYEAMIAAGGEFMSFDPLVLSGRRSGIMHTSHKRVPVHPGEPIVVELGAVFQRYVAPLERTICVGPPDDRVRRLALASETALQNVIGALRPGATAAEVVRAGEAGIALAGPDAFFHRGFAYGVGAAFPPNWVEGSIYVGGSTNPLGAADAAGQVRIQEGMVLNVPISLRIIGECGVMNGETVVVTRDGCEPLSELERRLFLK
jgi:Xaa-Pro aminopeptidase